MQKRWFRFLTALVLCAMTVLLPGVTASAENGGQTLAISVSLVDHQGHETHRLANGTVWAVIRLTGYTSDLEAATVILDLGSTAVGLGSPKRCLTPYEGAEAFVGADGQILSVMMTGSVTKQQLDDNGGEICRVELTRTGDTNEDAVLRVLERSGMVFTGVSLSDGSDVTPELGSYEYAVGNGASPAVSTLTPIANFSSDKSGWSFYKNTLLMADSLPNGNSRTAPQATGEPEFTSSSNRWRIGMGSKESLTTTTMTSEDTYDLSHGFTLTFRAVNDTSAGTTQYSKENWDVLFATVGDYTFTMKGYAVPQILCNGKRLAGEENKWTVADLSNFSSYNNGSSAYDESAAQAYNELGGPTKATIETNINTTWTTKLQAERSAESGSSLSKVLYTVSFDGSVFTFTKVANGTQRFSIQTAPVANTDSLKNASVSFGNQGAYGSRIFFSEPNLTITAGASTSYSVTAATCTADGAWTASGCDSKTIEAAHSFACVAESGANRLYQCSVCKEYSYEQGTTVLEKIPLSDCTVTLDTDVMQKTGAALTPEVTVSFGKGTLTKVLTKDIDYTVSYSNNTDAGIDTATVTVTAAGSLLSGSTTLNFTIVLAGDVNSDGKVDAADYARLKSYLDGKKTLSDSQLVAADLNGDKDVTKTDANALWNKLLRKAG